MISYFIPNKNGSNPQHLIDVGLDMLLRPDDDPPRFADLPGTGPDNLSGQLVSWQSQGLSYLPDQQDWFEIPADTRRKLPKGRYWVGTSKGAIPTPADFARTTMFEGPVEMMLSDGHQWNVPNSAAFPMKFGLGEDGELAKVPRADFKHLFQRTVWAMNLLEQAVLNSEDVDEEQSVDYCVELLSLNYRINREIALWLGLFDPKTITQFMMFTTDYNRITEIYEEVKKKDSP